MKDVFEIGRKAMVDVVSGGTFIRKVIGGLIAQDQLERILERINNGLEKSLTEKFPPQPIITTKQVVGYGEKRSAERSFYVDFSNPVQRLRAIEIAKVVKQALDSGSYPYMNDVHQYLKDMTRSRDD